MMNRFLLRYCAILALAGCYSFTGSSLPSHVRTVTVPLCENQTLKPGIAEALHQSLNTELIKGNLLRVVDRNGDSELNVRITHYANNPHTYDVNADVKEYQVEIAAEINFTDVKKYKTIYQGEFRGIGVYRFGSESEKQGEERALNDLSNAIISNTVSGW